MVAPGIYRHYKGGTYFVPGHSITFTGNGPANGQVMVGYYALDQDGLATDTLRVRPESEWTEPVPWPSGRTAPRFVHSSLLPKIDFWKEGRHG